MKIILKSYSPKAAATKAYFDAISSSDNFEVLATDDYENAEVALFMTYSSDLKELERVKRLHPNIKTAILDPRGVEVIPYLQFCDFLVMDSIEMRDYFAEFNLPIFTYFEFPLFECPRKVHKEKDSIIIGYHGNKVHLTAMFPKITTALKVLSHEFEIELWAIYDVKGLGYWNIGVPDDVKIRHIQWHPNVYINEMPNIDIGIIPSSMPIKHVSKMSRFFLDAPEDYVIKFKMPSNPGRLAVFAQIGIPVVADFLPSHFQFIDEGRSGFLADSTGMWLQSLRSLIESANLRKEFTDNMSKTYDENFCFKTQNKKFYHWLAEFISLDSPEEIKLLVTKDIEKPRYIKHLKFKHAFLYDTFFKLVRKFGKIFGAKK